jgi:hypothetical protein
MIHIQDLLKDEVAFTQTDVGFTITRFKFSTVAEFLDELKSLSKFKKFPFVFINAGTVEYDYEKPDDIKVSIGELVIATAFLDDKVYTSEEKDAKVFTPLLTPFLDAFLYRLDNSHTVAVYKYGKIKYHYRFGKDTKDGTDGDTMDDSVCAIRLTNFSFRILTNKNNLR